MSDLSEYRHEEVVDVPINAIGFFCRDCVPVIEVSEWPADTEGLPTPERGWSSNVVRLLNTTHARTCPEFMAYVAETGASVRLAVVSDEGWEHVLLRETLDLGRASD